MTTRLRLMDVEDRPLILFDNSTALLFKDGNWMMTTVEHARKAMLEGYELSWVEFCEAYPKATSTALPLALLQQALSRAQGRSATDGAAL